MIVRFVYDRSSRAADVLAALVRAVARAAADGMPVELERVDVTSAVRAPVVSVQIDGVGVEILTPLGIYAAIARAFGRPFATAPSLPRAVVRRPR